MTRKLSDSNYVKKIKKRLNYHNTSQEVLCKNRSATWYSAEVQKQVDTGPQTIGP